MRVASDSLRARVCEDRESKKRKGGNKIINKKVQKKLKFKKLKKHTHTKTHRVKNVKVPRYVHKKQRYLVPGIIIYCCIISTEIVHSNYFITF